MTDVISVQIDALRRQSAYQVDVCQIDRAPAGIGRQSDADMAAPLVQEIVRSEKAAAYIIACFSDPGLLGAREDAGEQKIVLGCGESAILHALVMGDKFGVIALSALSVLRQRRMVRVMGLTERYAGSAAIDVSAEEATSPALIEQMVEAGQVLARQGANVILLGCAGMGHFRKRLEQRLGLPVIDPTSAALAMAFGLCALKDSRIDDETT